MAPSVHATRCTSYDRAILKPLLEEHLDLYEGFQDLKGKKVLLKVNLLMGAAPEKGVTTNPELLKALTGIIKERGGEAIIADSPGGPFNKILLAQAYKASGYDKVAKQTGAQLNFNTSFHEKAHPEGRFVKRFTLCDYLDDADLVIAVPKVKTHVLCGLTCASKIMYGAVPGTAKVQFHTRFPDPVDFSRMLLDLTDLTAPDLFIVDGIIGMDGEGPRKGNLREVGIVVSGKDHAAIDLAVCRMVGLPPEELTIMQACFREKVISPSSRIHVTGDAADFKLERDFEFVKGNVMAGRPPTSMNRLVRNLTTKVPKVDQKRCVGCEVCRDNCAAGNAITITNEKARISRSRCIRCYCCHELCPYDAIYLTPSRSALRGFIDNLIFKLFS